MRLMFLVQSDRHLVFLFHSVWITIYLLILTDGLVDSSYP